MYSHNHRTAYQYHKDLGQRVKSLRMIRGLTLRELAQEAGVGHAQLCRIEHGEANPSVDTLARISAALGVRVYDLFDDGQ